MSDSVIPQRWADYTPEQHAVWDTLYDRQRRLLPGRAAQAFVDGLDKLQLSRAGIPDFEELSDRLEPMTGWRVLAVPGLVPDEEFFRHLANRRFVAGNFIRRADQLDYLQEPDVFHDVFGHVPLLSDPVFADYLQAYGQGGLRSMKFASLDHLARLYWYTVEFGLIREAGGLRIYGSGIVSSYGESRFALDSDSPNRIAFDLMRVMRTPYRIDDFQQVYFVIDSFDDLLHDTRDRDFAPLYAALDTASDIAIAAIEPGDDVIHTGTQDYANSRAA